MPKIHPSNLRHIHRLCEQCLSGLGVLRPQDVRAEGGTPQDVLRPLLVDVSRLYDDLLTAIRESVHDKDGKAVLDEAALSSAVSAWESGFALLLEKAVNDAVQAGLQSAADELGVEVSWLKVDQGIISALQAQAVNLCEATAAKIKGDVKTQLLESLRLGETMTQAMERLQKISSLTGYEAERICRTELAKAANTARLQGYKGRVEKVKWVLGPAYNGNCGCAEMAGEYTLEEASQAQMPLHPNCDCYWVAVVPD